MVTVDGQWRDAAKQYLDHLPGGNVHPWLTSEPALPVLAEFLRTEYSEAVSRASVGKMITTLRARTGLTFYSVFDLPLQTAVAHLGLTAPGKSPVNDMATAQGIAVSPPTVPTSDTPDIALDAEDISILKTLEKRAGQLMTGYDIEADSRVSRRTISKRMSHLLTVELVARPRGKKQGTTITEKGKHILKQLASKASQ